MAILLNRDTRLLTIGYTGKQGTFHSLECRDYGTTFVGGVTPGKGNTMHEGHPVFNTVYSAVKKTAANTAMIMVPPQHAADAILECIDAKIPLIVCITEGIPVLDMLKVKAALRGTDSRLLGPNGPGIITPGESKVGIMPGHIHMPGRVGVISRSATLMYEAVYQLTQAEIGQSTCVGIGADSIIGMSFIDCLQLFENDKETDAVIVIGEVGGTDEILAAQWFKENFSKPALAYVAGLGVPRGRLLGHAGAIISGSNETAEAKFKMMETCGMKIVHSPAQIGIALSELINTTVK